MVASAVVVILVGLGIYYSVLQSGPKSSPKPVTENIDITAPRVETAAAELSPQNFTAIEGQNVTLVVDNMDNATHFLMISKFGVYTNVIQPGQTVRVSFVANQVGVFPIYQADVLTGPCETYSACHLNQGYVTVIAP
jgi:hypothetical protein